MAGIARHPHRMFSPNSSTFISDHEIRCPNCRYVEDLLTNPEEGMRPRPLDCNFVKSWFCVGTHHVPCFKCGYEFSVEVRKRGERFRFDSPLLLGVSE